MTSETRPRTQESRSAAARAQLVKAAVELLSELGFARATTAAIAAKAGVTTGALHHHFPTKEHLFVAVLDELTEQALALFRNLGHTADSTASLARAIVMELWSLYGSTQYWAVWEINMGYRANDAMRRQLIDHRSRTRERMYQTLLANEILSADTKEVLLASLGFMLSTLRGIFLDTFYAEGQNELLRTQLSELVAVLERRLAIAVPQSGFTPTAGAVLA
jgi:AcrR family transcriptional regulator